MRRQNLRTVKKENKIGGRQRRINEIYKEKRRNIDWRNRRRRRRRRRRKKKKTRRNK